MGDAFKGLTIRIGADSRPLASALSSIKSAAGQAQAPINRLSRALKDGAVDAQAMSARVGLMQDKITLAARATHQVTAAWNQAGSVMRHAVEQGKGMYSNTQRIRMEMRDTNQQIQRMHDAMAKVRADANELKLREDLSAQIKKLEADMSALPKKSGKEFAQLNIKLTEAKKKLKELDTATGKKKLFANALTEVKQLSHALGGTGDEARKAEIELRNIAKSIKAADKPLDIFDDNNIKRANQILEYLRQMKTLHNQLQAEQTFANQAQELSQARVHMAAYRAEMRQAIMEQTRFEAELTRAAVTPGVERATVELKSMDAALDAATESARKMDAALKEVPTSVTAATAKVRALNAAEKTAVEKISALENKMRELSSATGFNAAAAASRDVYVAAEKASAAYMEVKEKVKLCEAALEQLEEESRQAQAAMSAGTAGAGAKYDEIQAEIKETIADLGKLEAEERQARASFTNANMAAEYRQLDEELVQVYARLRQIQNMNLGKGAFAGMLGDLRTLGYGLYSTVTPAILMAGRYAVNSAEEVDSAYRDMRKTVNGTEEQFEGLRQSALEFGRTHVTSADQILEIESIGGQLGIAADDLEQFATTVSNLDIATNMDTEDIALDLAKLSNIMHFSSEQYDSFADALVRLGNNEPALESDIMKISTRFAGMAANVGMSTEDMLAFATAATATGQKAEAAGSSFQRTLGRIETAVAQGGEGLNKYAEISGMTADEFKEAWEDTGNHGPARAIQAFINGLHDVHERGDSVTATLRELGITGVRDTQQLEGLSNITDILAESLGMASDAWRGTWTEMEDGSIEYAGDAAREAGRKAEGFSGQLQIMKNAAQELGVTLLDSTVPMLTDLTSMFQGFTGAVSAAPDWMKDFGIKAAVAVAAAGPLLIAVGAIGDAVTKGGAAWEKFQASLAQAQGMARSSAKYQEYSAQIKKLEFEIRNLIAVQERQALATGKTNAAIGREIAARQKEAASLEKVREGYAKTNAIMSKFKGAMKLAGGLVAADLVVEAFMRIGGAIGTAIENANNFRTATQGLAEANVVPSVDAVSDSIGRIAQQATDSAMSVTELTAAGAEMVSTMTDRTTKAQNQIARLNEAKKIISEYGSQSSHTAAEMGAFSMAVSTVNELCHAQVGIADMATGALTKQGKAVKDVASEIGGLVDMQVQELQTTTLEANLKEMNEQVSNAFDTVAKLKAESAKMDNGAMFDGMYAMPDAVAQQMAATEGDLAKAQEVLESFVNKQQDMVEAYGAMKAVASGYNVDATTIANASLKLRGALDAYGEGMFDTFVKSLGSLNVNAQSLQALLSDDSKIFALSEQFYKEGANAQALDGILKGLGVTFNSGTQQATAFGTAMQQATAGMSEEEASQFTEEIEKDVEVLGELTEKFPELQSKLTPANGDIQSFALTLRNAGIDIEAMSSSITEMANTASNGFQKIERDSSMSLESYRQNLESNKALMEEWGSNLRKAYETAGENDVARAWIKSVSEAGPQYAGMVAEMANMSEEELTTMAQLWADTADSGAQAAMDAYGYSADAITGSAGKARKGVEEMAKGAEDAASKTKDALSQAGDYEGKPELDMSAFEGALGIANNVKDSLGSMFDTTFGASMNVQANDEASATIDDVADKAASMDDANIGIYAEDHATGTIGYIKAALNDLHDKTIHIHTSYTSSGSKPNASGGILPRYAQGAVFPKVAQSVPRFASGSAINGIVARPTMTNVGLTGEAGAEAILHMKHAGGAIIPLSNRRYVRPFARAVASEMGAGGKVVNVNVSLNYTAGSDATDMALDIANQLNAVLDMEG